MAEIREIRAPIGLSGAALKHMYRFFVNVEAFQNEDVIFSSGQAHQIRNVLRMRPEQCVVVLDDRGWEYDVVLRRVERQMVSGRITARRSAGNEPGVEVTLCQGLLKQDKYEWVLQKGTELGVTRFVPLVTQRSIVQKPELISAKKQSRWMRIIREAAEQSQRGRLPMLSSPITLEAVLQEMAEDQLMLFPWEQADQQGLRSALPESPPDRVALFVGPEGGFATEEVELARVHGAIPVSLGPRILRSETAAIAAVTIVLYQLQELG